MHSVIYTASARHDLRNLEKVQARRIVKKISFWTVQANPLKFAKRLTNPAMGEYRFRVGDYRVLFDVDHSGNIFVLMILRIKHRKDVYGL
ncbi:type II toxin-antitoxin system RelE/ParE family toxin [Candidatus Peregrinibacteria bacterium]|nr:type II toxin-antitoxin system RelE/ParE family toxin [Candidatus Peregrinibacteria bacterium]